MLVTSRLALLGNVFPTYAWDFRRGALPPGATFTRASTARYFGANGLQQSAAINTPRYEVEPSTGLPIGLLSEVQSTNLALHSKAIDNGAWTKQKLTVTADQIAAPDGNTTADKITEDGTSGGHEVYYQAPLAADTYAGFSVFVKAGTRSKFFISYGSGAVNHYATVIFDATTGSISQTAVGSGSGAIASTYARAVGNGWYRFGMVAKVAGANAFFLIGTATAATGNIINTGGEVTYAGDGASYGYIWGAQQDSPGAGITSYIPTVASTVTRAQDILSLPLSSLPGWQASQGGVLVATYRLFGVPLSDAHVAVLGDGTSANEISINGGFGGGDTRWRTNMTSASVSQFSLNITAPAQPAPFVRRRAAVGWGATRGLTAAGGTVGGLSSGSFALPTVTALQIGYRGGLNVNGTIESVAYYVGQRPDAFVQAVSRG